MNAIIYITGKVRFCIAAVVRRIAVYKSPLSNWYEVHYSPAKLGSSNCGYITLFIFKRRICFMTDKTAYLKWAQGYNSYLMCPFQKGR